ncbi:transposase [Paenibacillus rhizoplanae]
MASGVSATYVLMDSWFTHAPLIGRVVERGLHVIGMVKKTTTSGISFTVSGWTLTGFTDLQHKCKGSSGIFLRQIHTELVPGIPVVVVFVRHRSKKKNEWLAILSTDLTLTAPEIIQIYALRWDIEVFF